MGDVLRVLVEALAAGFEFEYAEWPVAARELVGRWRAARLDMNQV
jgi:hypothetical protein